MSGTAQALRSAPAISEREAFLAVLFNGPLLPADAILVLSGDGFTRLPTALELLRQGATAVQNGDGPYRHTVVLSGGSHNPPYAVDAEHLLGPMLEKGVKPGWLRLETDSTNTYEQATALTAMAKSERWRRVLLVTSAYHMPRAFLTFVAAMEDAGMEDTLHVCCVPVSQFWWERPAGLAVTRLDLLAAEAEKIQRYGELGHVASYEAGLAYIERWEGR
jgi:hypothetical protein